MVRERLQKGDLVEVRTADEILRTLDERGDFESLPFMPEMVRYCGQQATVAARADRVCDTILGPATRHMADTVLLDDLRCDGSGHEGSAAQCRFYWKEAWVKRVRSTDRPPTSEVDQVQVAALVERVTRNSSVSGESLEPRFRCQATQAVVASVPVSPSDPRSYLDQYTNGNVSLPHFIRVMCRAVVIESTRKLHVSSDPPFRGPGTSSPKLPILALAPGDWVRVKSREEIEATLNEAGKNRGLLFDREMLRFCGKVFRVGRRVQHLIDDRTGEMIELTSDCVILDGAVCSGEQSYVRWFCPRAIFPFWARGGLNGSSRRGRQGKRVPYRSHPEGAAEVEDDLVERTPRVSIGLPVYNGEVFLEEAIESLLSQTYRDFELIIADNASTDRTQEICLRYANKDSRVRYWRNPRNLGGMKNANLTFELSRGQYFRFAGYDDRCAPTFLERLVEEIDQRPEVTICLAATVQIDADGTELRTDYPTQGTAATPRQRFRETVLSGYYGGALYGLIRSDVLRQTGLHGNYTGSDLALVCELALYGPFHLVAEPLFFNRYHPGNVYTDSRAKMAWSRPELMQTGRPTFPNWLRLIDYIRIVNRVPLPASDRAFCFFLLGQWVVMKRRGLAWDALFAVVMLVHSKEWRMSRYAPERW